MLGNTAFALLQTCNDFYSLTLVQYRWRGCCVWRGLGVRGGHRIVTATVEILPFPNLLLNKQAVLGVVTGHPSAMAGAQWRAWTGNCALISCLRHDGWCGFVGELSAHDSQPLGPGQNRQRQSKWEGPSTAAS